MKYFFLLNAAAAIYCLYVSSIFWTRHEPVYAGILLALVVINGIAVISGIKRLKR